MTNQWIARIRDLKYPGGYSSRDGLNLHCRLHDAGLTHTGRPVELIIDPSQLDTMLRMVKSAIAVRDGVDETD